MKLKLPFCVATLSSILALSSTAHAQSMARYTLDTWKDRDLAETYDHPIIELGGHVNNDSQDEQMFHWDSYGRVRINRDDPDAPFFGYRVLFADAASDSPLIRSSMDEFDLAMGFKLGQLGDWDLSTMLGAGYSSTHPFVNTTGIYGIGHLLGEHHIDDNTSIVLSVDYEGNAGLLPDIPLPGFAIRHHEEKFDFMFGYPMSAVHVHPIEKLDITATYTVPFTADIDAEYSLANHVGLYSDIGNFYQGFVQHLPGSDVTNRQFFQMRRAELGVRFIYDPWIDASVGIGYAFDQGYSVGFDVRNTTPVTHISNEPYVAFMIRGRF